MFNLLRSDTSQDQAVCLVFGEITMDTAQTFTEWILDKTMTEYVDDEGNPLPKPTQLTVIINSIGGDLAAAWTICDLITSCPIPVKTIGSGQVASAALLILSAGHPGMRYINENTSVMSHQYYWASEGKHHELIAKIHEYELTNDRLVKFWEKVTRMTEDDIKEKLMPPTDVFMSAQEANGLGLCDFVNP